MQVAPVKKMASKKVCVIGAGPSGMNFLLHMQRFKQAGGNNVPVITCYEKQDNWGGLWNYTWRTGSDENGEPCHGSMYKALWMNGPKEACELPDYTWDEHFGRELPSYLPREMVFDYLQGRWEKEDLKKLVTFSHVVRSVVYNDGTDDFTVIVENLVEKKVLPPQTFDFVCVASGHYSVPFTPEYPGVDTFPGRVMHSHDFRNAKEFAGQRVLLVGSSYSAEDIATQTIKYGAKEAILTYRTQSTGYPWPSNISERPIMTKVDKSTVHFSDGSQADFDAIIFCTGYLGHHPFMADNLRCRSPDLLYNPNMYKGMIYTNGGNSKVLYLGRPTVIYTFTMFDVQAFWSAKYILGDIKLPSKDEMENQSLQWYKEGFETLATRDELLGTAFQTKYCYDLIKESGFEHDIDLTELIHEWHDDRVAKGVLSYRDRQFTSLFTKKKSLPVKMPFMENMNHSKEQFLAMY